MRSLVDRVSCCGGPESGLPDHDVEAPEVEGMEWIQAPRSVTVLSGALSTTGQGSAREDVAPKGKCPCAAGQMAL